jgi:hypothetical protein
MEQGQGKGPKVSDEPLPSQRHHRQRVEQQGRGGTNTESSLRAKGGFNFILFFGISIGIKWRMIDMGKKIIFGFLQNV